MNLLSKIFLIPLMILCFTGCDCLFGPTEEEAKVTKESNLYVFVFSSPQKEFKQIGAIDKEMIEGIYNDVSGAENGREILQNIKKAIQGLKAEELIQEIAKRASQQYGDRADAIMFEDSLVRCKVLEFK